MLGHDMSCFRAERRPGFEPPEISCHDFGDRVTNDGFPSGGHYRWEDEMTKIYLVMRDSGDGARLGIAVRAFDDEASAVTYQRDCQEWECKLGQFRQEFWVTSVEYTAVRMSGRGEFSGR